MATQFFSPAAPLNVAMRSGRLDGFDPARRGGADPHERKHESENRAFSQFGGQGDLGAHPAREAAADCESKAGSFRGASQPSVQLHEWLEYRFQLLGSYSWTVVFNADQDRILVRHAGDFDSATRRRELHRVGEEIDQY